MLGGILSWLATGGIAAIGRELNRAYEARLAAQNDSERIAAEVAIKNLEAQRDSILAAQRDRVERWVRIGFALPFVIYNAKLVLWDKVLGWGATDPLSADLVQLQWIVIGGYFFVSTARIIRK